MEKNWSRIQAKDSFGNIENVTNEYLRNMSLLTVKTNGNVFLANRTRIIIESVLLKRKVSDRCNQQIELIIHKLAQNDTFQVKLGQKKEYQITTILDLFVINSKSTQALDLTTERTIELEIEKMLSIITLRLIRLGFLFDYSILFIAFGYLIANPYRNSIQ